MRFWKNLTIPRVVNAVWKNKLFSIFILMTTLLPGIYMVVNSEFINQNLRQKANELSLLSTSVRDYYAKNIVSRIQEADGKAVLAPDYVNVHGGIPIPATFSIELGEIFNVADLDENIQYRFASDFPFKPRQTELNMFERESIDLFRKNPLVKQNEQIIRGSGNQRTFQYATPVVMSKACIQCHNSHPNSRKRDWKVGDVRGIQEIIIRDNDVTNLFDNKTTILPAYLLTISLLGLTITANTIRSKNKMNEIYKSLKEKFKREQSISSQYLEQITNDKIFKRVIEGSNTGIVICDARASDNPALFVNKKFTEITGYEQEFAIGKNCKYLQGPETEIEEIVKIRKCLQMGITYTGVLTNYRKDGSTFKNYLSIVPIFDKNSNKPTLYLANQISYEEHQTKEIVGIVK